MARTDDDTWELGNGVGATATGVAVGRALATRAPQPLINDRSPNHWCVPSASTFTRLANGELDPAAVDDNGDFGMLGMADIMGLRTRFFDDFFITTAGTGIRQAVILTSVLDARAYRPALAGRHDGIRDRPVAGHRVQDRGPRRAGRRADGRPAGGGSGPSPRLAGRAAHRGPGPRPTPRGAPRTCCRSCRQTPRIACWTTSLSSARQAASWPPRTCRAPTTPCGNSRTHS